jgi:hypothetical protein
VIKKCNKNKRPHPVEQLYHKKRENPPYITTHKLFCYCIGVKEKNPKLQFPHIVNEENIKKKIKNKTPHNTPVVWGKTTVFF